MNLILSSIALLGLVGFLFFAFKNLSKEALILNGVSTLLNNNI